MSERDDAEVTLRLTAEERLVVREALRRYAHDLEREVSSSVWAFPGKADVAAQRNDVRRVLALVTEDGDA